MGYYSPISAQLRHGIRAFDIWAKYWPDDDEVIWNQHGDCDMDTTLVASLGEIGIFLDNHPSAVVVVFLSQAGYIIHSWIDKGSCK